MSKQEDIAVLTYHLGKYIVKDSDYEMEGPIEGSVCKVKSKIDGKYYARKSVRISNDVGYSQKYVYREIYALAQTDYECLCKLRGFSVSEEKNEVYIYTDFINGGSLASYTVDDTSENYQELLRKNEELTVIAYGIALGCMRFHDLGFIHRGIKPENILIKQYKDKNGNERREPVIIGFGASRDYNPEKSKQMTMFGPDGYTAPEVYYSIDSTASYSNSIDVFSYGRVLYTMVEFVAPDKGFTRNRFGFSNNLRIESDIPENLRQLIEDCQNSDPEKRPSFESIVKMFRDNQIYFSDEDKNECLAYLKEYMSRVDPDFMEEEEEEEEKEEEEKSESGCTKVNKLALIIESYQGSKIPENIIDAIVESLSVDEIEDYVNSVLNGINKIEKTDEDVDWETTLGNYYLFMKKIILRSHEFAERAAKIDLHSKLVVDNDNYTDSIFTILVNIIQFTPNKITTYFLIYYLSCSRHKMKYVAFLYSMFIRYADKYSEEYHNFVTAFVSSYEIEKLVDEKKYQEEVVPPREFFKCGLVEEYFQCVLCLEEFDENIIEELNNHMISYILEEGKNVEYLHTLYKFVFAVSEKECFEIPKRTVLQHLSSDSILKYDAISYIAAFGTPVKFSKLYPILEETAPNHTASVYLLVNYINNDKEKAQTILETWEKNVYSNVPKELRLSIACAVIGKYGTAFACEYDIVTSAFLKALKENVQVDKIVSSFKNQIVPENASEDEIKQIYTSFDKDGFWDKMVDAVIKNCADRRRAFSEFLFVAMRISKVLPIPAFVKLIKKEKPFKAENIMKTVFLKFLQNYLMSIQRENNTDLLNEVEGTKIINFIHKNRGNEATCKLCEKILQIYNDIYLKVD